MNQYLLLLLADGQATGGTVGSSQVQRRQRRQVVRCPTVVVIQGEGFGLVATACTVPPGPGLHLVELVAVPACPWPGATTAAPAGRTAETFTAWGWLFLGVCA